MARYPGQPLEEKLDWMRERMKAKAAREAEGAVVQRSVSPARYRRGQLLKSEMPAHLRMFRVAEVAEMLGVSPAIVRREFEDRATIIGQSETTPSRRRHRILLISQRDLEEWLEEHRG
jgi:hypothetical protein